MMFGKILVAIDGSKTSLKALKTAIALAGDQGAHLDIVHVADVSVPVPALAAEYVSQEAMSGVIRDIELRGSALLADARSSADAAGVDVAVHMLETMNGDVAAAILREARRVQADVIVLGTHGRRGVRRVLMGSDAESVLREARVPVLLVRGSG